jgi:RNA polymerase sigma-70 factor, ECF subfamily
MSLAPLDAPLDPAALVDHIRSGQAGAEDELVRRYGRGLTFILTRSCSDTSIVEDLLQDTFRVALEKIRRGDLRDPARLSGFLCSLARNLVVEHFRKASSRRVASNVGDAAFVSFDPDPQEQALRSERLAIVRQVLSELSSGRDRQILYRFYIAEDEKPAICRDLGLSSLHFNRVLFRARERYRELYLRRTAGAKPPR